ncbi:MAG: ferrous iron transport protein A [Lachnospiraceae bacterium]|nr:ferrous iron transport protein A [Lachnospiraceae bacterium]
MPLTMAAIGDTATIRKISGKDETRRFLENLGFVAGTVVTIISRVGENVIVSIKDSRVAIDSNLAKKILI